MKEILRKLLCMSKNTHFQFYPEKFVCDISKLFPRNYVERITKPCKKNNLLMIKFSSYSTHLSIHIESENVPRDNKIDNLRRT